MCRIKFFLISEENKSTHAMTRPRKIEKTEKPVSGTFLKANVSKNEKVIKNYICLKNFHIIPPQKADLRLRKLFSRNFPIS